MICFEVAYDGLVRSSVAAGAQLVVVQTNNATFGHTAETYQQLAMTRLRAVETGRTVVQVATTGISAVIGPDGGVRMRSGALFTPDVLVGDGAAAHGHYAGNSARRVARAAARRCGADRARARRPTGTPAPHRGRTPTRRRSQPLTNPPEGAAEQRVLVVIPTYNERENLAAITRRVGAAVPTAHVLVVDDAARTAPASSPTSWPTADDRIHVLHRAAKGGLGAAYIAGFGWGLADGLRRAGRDGRRRLARSGAAAPVAAARWTAPTW